MSSTNNTMAGKAVIVTGAASGMGRAAAKIIADAGGRILVADLNQKGGEETVKMISDSGGEASFYQMDLADESSIKGMVSECVTRYGRLDGAFNNAAIPHVVKPFHEVSNEDWDRGILINLTGLFWCMKYELLVMKDNGGGNIVNTSSMSAITGSPLTCEYSAAKGGVISLTRQAAVEYARLNIRVNAILPGIVNTPMTVGPFAADPELKPRLEAASILGRFGEPEEIGSMALCLLSDASSYVTGQWLSVDGGQAAAN